MIDLYTAATPNGHKISIALEELGLPYTVHALNSASTTRSGRSSCESAPTAAFPRSWTGTKATSRCSSPAPSSCTSRRRRPAHAHGREGPIARHAVADVPDGRHRPDDGQANVFFRYFPEKIQPAIDRYQGEVRRLFGVLDTRLAEHEYLAGDYSIADIANWAWVRTHKWSGVALDGLRSCSAGGPARRAARVPARHRRAAAAAASRGRRGRREVHRGSAQNGRDRPAAG